MNSILEALLVAKYISLLGVEQEPKKEIADTKLEMLVDDLSETPDHENQPIQYSFSKEPLSEDVYNGGLDYEPLSYKIVPELSPTEEQAKKSEESEILSPEEAKEDSRKGSTKNTNCHSMYSRTPTRGECTFTRS